MNNTLEAIVRKFRLERMQKTSTERFANFAEVV